MESVVAVTYDLAYQEKADMSSDAKIDHVHPTTSPVSAVPATEDEPAAGGVGHRRFAHSSKTVLKHCSDRLRHLWNRDRSAAVYDLPFNLLSYTPAAPTRPAVRGLPTSPPELGPFDAKRAARLDRRMTALVDRSIDRHRTAPSRSGNAGLAATMLCARHTDVATCVAIDELFVPRGSLGELLLQDLKESLEDEDATRIRESALCMAMAIRAVTSKPHRAERIWAAITAGQPCEGRPDLANNALRLLADSEMAFDALWRLKAARGHGLPPERREAYKVALQATAQLSNKLGIRPGNRTNPQGIDDFAALARVWLHKPPARIGSTEGREVLALQALLAAHAVLKGGQPENAQQIAAFTAWRNGYRESGPGTEFNEVAERLHKFTTWIVRAVRNPKLSLASRARLGVASAFGKSLNPLSAMRHGMIGADRKLLKTAQQEFESALKESIGIVKNALADKVRQRMAGVPAQDVVDAAVRHAMLERWLSDIGPRKNVRLPAKVRREVMTIAADSLDLDAAQLRKPRFVGQRLTLSTLEKWGAAVCDETAAKQLSTAILGARQAARATSPKPSSLTIDTMRQMAKDAIDGAVGVSFRHGGAHGLDLSPSVGIRTPWGSVSAGLGPQLRGLRGRQAMARFGSNSAASEVLLGSDRRLAGQLGFLGRIGASFGHGVSGQAGGSVSEGIEVARTNQAAAIRVPKGTPGQRETMKDVVDFYFDKAAERDTGESIDVALLWERFSNRFFDKPEISVSRQILGATTQRSSGQLNAGARLGSGDYSVGPTVGMGTDAGGYRDGWQDTHGAMKGQLENVGWRDRMALSVGLSGRPASLTRMDSGLLADLRMPTAWLGGASVDVHIDGMEGQTRVVMLNGRVSANHTLLYQKYANRDDHLLAVRRMRRELEMELDKSPDKHPLGGTATLNRYLQEVASMPTDTSAGNRYYMIRKKLTDEAARQFDFPLALRQLCEALGPNQNADDGHRAIDEVVAGILKNPHNWVPEKLSPYEVDSHTVDKGFTMVLSLRSRTQVHSLLRNLVDLVF